MFMKTMMVLLCSSMALGMLKKLPTPVPGKEASNPNLDKAKQATSDKLFALVDKGSSTELLAALIRGADPNHTINGVSLLEHARAEKKDKIAEILIRYGAEGDTLASAADNATTSADENSCALHQAVLSGQVAEVAKILAADPNIINITDDLGRTALHHAAITGNHDMLAELIGNGADTSIQDNLGRTAADYADFAMDEGIAAALQPATKPADEADEDYDAIIDSVLAVREQNKTCNNFNNL